jgi:AraC family transcriptional regulator of adaptative response / DNA-3-methyladenine glycosylase II
MTTYSAVVTTGIYCRPGCGARPLAHNVRLFDHPAGAEAAGFRACHRCRPYRVAGPVGSSAPDLVCEAVQRIIMGALDDGGTEAALARQVGISARQLRRLFLQHLGATPDQLARSRRAHFARRLLDDTDLTAADIAFASGFGSLRQFNRSMREVFGGSPTDLRDRRRRADRLAADGGLALRLPTLPGYRWDAMCAFLAARRLPGVETVANNTYRRTITLAGAPGLLEVSPGDQDCLLLRVHLPYWEGLIHVVERVSQLLGTERDESAGVAALRGDPVLGPLVAERPGLAVPGAWNPFELEAWAVLSGRSDRDRLLEALITSFGRPIPGLPDGLTHAFPDRAAVADRNLAALGFPAAEAEAITRLAAGHGANSSYVAFRTGRRDAFPLEDPALRAALADLGLSGPAIAWQPWLALAAAHLIAHGDRCRDRDEAVCQGSGRRPMAVTR